ncbi:hypothetical protein FHW36_101807 [Chitinophaga polysaccharea]|uniref:Uncharacterized protein n=1 Tax=Chitinophaga polysaccharea TaxID=1293035 RepID=A0A561Q3D4_9BACT|nr:hypothetical protein FHW36_101807 [Chitinophaga polysaccharea]
MLVPVVSTDYNIANQGLVVSNMKKKPPPISSNGKIFQIQLLQRNVDFLDNLYFNFYNYIL